MEESCGVLRVIASFELSVTKASAKTTGYVCKKRVQCSPHFIKISSTKENSLTKKNTYSFTKEPKLFSVEDRKNDSIRRDMELAEANRNEIGAGDIFGVKGESVLMDSPYYDLVFGFPVEYLHAVLLGSTRHVTMLWFDSTSYGKMYYLGKRINAVNKRLLNIKPPITLSRMPKNSGRKKRLARKRVEVLVALLQFAMFGRNSSKNISKTPLSFSFCCI